MCIYFYVCIGILRAFPLKMFIAWPLLCYDLPRRKVLAPDYISSSAVPPNIWGCPRVSWGAQSGCRPVPCSFCIQHRGGRSLRLWLISACYRCQNDVFLGRANVASNSSLHPACAWSRVWSASLG